MAGKTLIESIIFYLQSLPKEVITIIIATLPIFELRGAIPVGVLLNISLSKTIILAIIGNLIPVIPLLILLKPVSEKLRQFRLWHRFFEWLFERTQKRARLIERYGALGLVFFVAIPLPITGAWTGCIAATLFKIRFKYAFPAITAGVLIAGIIVTAITLLGKQLL